MSLPKDPKAQRIVGDWWSSVYRPIMADYCRPNANYPRMHLPMSVARPTGAIDRVGVERPLWPTFCRRRTSQARPERLSRMGTRGGRCTPNIGHSRCRFIDLAASSQWDIARRGCIRVVLIWPNDLWNLCRNEATATSDNS